MNKAALKLVPRAVEKVWGGTGLKERFSDRMLGGRIGESWEIHGDLHIAGGLWDGMTLNELTWKLGEKLLGENSGPVRNFPLLTKWLDCQDWLSVQVHPDDALARSLTGAANALGKSECWYVHRAEAEAEVIHGMEERRRASELFAAQGEEILKFLKRRHVAEGEFLNTPPGTVHALGPGLMIYEVQQSSDLTYRLYDWGRHRETHPIESQRAILEAREQAEVLDRGVVIGELKALTPHFAIELLEHCAIWEVDESSFEIIVCLEEEAWCCGQEMEAGSAIILPAGCGEVDLVFHGGKCLRVRVP